MKIKYQILPKFNTKPSKDIYLESYKKFLLNPDKELDNFSHNIYELSYIASKWSKDIYEIYNDIINDKDYKKIKSYHYLCTLQSNGSTSGIQRSYSYSFLSLQLKNKIWEFMHRFYIEDNIKKYWINNCSKTSLSKITNKINNEGYITNINPKTIYKIQDEMKNSFWITNPYILNIICNNNILLNFIKENNIKISITSYEHSDSYNFSILQELNIPLVNQMRSWSEGTAFYTCPYNKKHWMENLFYCTEDNKIIDLLNVHNDWWEDSNVDNIFPLENEYKKCECGAWYRELNFQSQYNKRFKNEQGEIADYKDPNFEFINNYKFFQIIQQEEKDKFIIHCNKEISKDIIDKISLFLNNIYKNKYSISYNNSIFTIGNKYPIFWSLAKKE